MKSITTAILVLLVAACGSSDKTDGATAAAMDAGPSADAGPSYPAGPYGTEVGATATNFAFQGLAAPAYDPAQPTSVKLSDFYDPSGAGGRKLIVVNVCSVWCVLCKPVTESFKTKAAEYGPKGVTIVSVLFENGDLKPISLAEASSYAKERQAGIPFMIDPAYQLGGFLKPVEVPVSIVLSARDMKVLGSSATIFDPSELWQFVDQKLSEIR